MFKVSFLIYSVILDAYIIIIISLYDCMLAS